jgi:hypothetical protein
LLEEEDSANHICDVLLMPPEQDDVSDEDSDDEDGLLPKDANHLGKGILSQLSELQVYDTEDELPDLTVIDSNGDTLAIIPDDTAAEPQAGPSQRTRGKKRKDMEDNEDDEEEEDEDQEDEEQEQLQPQAGPQKLAR